MGEKCAELHKNLHLLVLIGMKFSSLLVSTAAERKYRRDPALLAGACMACSSKTLSQKITVYFDHYLTL